MIPFEAMNCIVDGYLLNHHGLGYPWIVSMYPFTMHQLARDARAWVLNIRYMTKQERN